MNHFDGDATVVLAISDNKNFKEWLVDVVDQAGCSVLSFGNDSQSKKEIVQVPHFDIAIIDLRLPQGGWIDFLCLAREKNNRCGIIVVAELQAEKPPEMRAGDYFVDNARNDGEGIVWSINDFLKKQPRLR